MNVVPGDALVVRLWRWDAERLVKDAQTDYLERQVAGEVDPPHSISVFAMEMEDGETIENLRARLCAHVSQFRKARHAAFTTKSRLTAEGFLVDENTPPPHHYDVILNNPQQDEEYFALQRLFEEEERVPFPLCTTS